MAEPYESRKITDNNEVLRECEALEAELAELRAAYEQYFLGLEKRPPQDRHKSLKRRLQNQKGYFIRATSVKFRVQNLAQKFSTYERLWTRTLQEIENGTYHRDLSRLRRKQKSASAVAPGTAEKKRARDDFNIDEISPEEVDALLSGSLFDEKPSAPEVAPRRAPVVPTSVPAAASARGTTPPRPAAPTGGGSLSEDKLRAVYDAFVKAKKRCNEDVSKLSYDQVAQSLRKQVPELMTKHKAKSVEFKVVIKDGKAVLRAVPKEG